MRQVFLTGFFMKVRCTGGSRISDLLWLLTEPDMMMLPTLCDSSSLLRKSRSLTYTELVILMLVLVFMLANNGPTLRALVGSVIDAVEFWCSTNNNSLLLITPSDVISNRALYGIHRKYKTFLILDYLHNAGNIVWGAQVSICSP